MILLTRLHGGVFTLNPHLIERAEYTPDTEVTLVTGATYLIAESLPELIAAVREYRAAIANDIPEPHTAPPAPPATTVPRPDPTAGGGTVVPMRRGRNG